MGGLYRRARTHKGRKLVSKTSISRAHHDLIVDSFAINDTEVQDVNSNDADLPGGGKFFCKHCARHFQDQHALSAHLVSKQHKKQVRKITKLEPYSHVEAESSAGLGTYRRRVNPLSSVNKQ